MNGRAARLLTLGVLVCVLSGAALTVTATPASAAADNTWVVTSDADTADPCAATCTLRAAIAAANASSGSDLIVFNIGSGGQRTIHVGNGSKNPLPAITGDDVTIDGSTQPDGGPRGIRVHDPDTSGDESGLIVYGQRARIHGLIITSFDRFGILFDKGSRDNLVTGTWIGTPDGVTRDGTGSDGIRIIGGGGNTIGGTTAAERVVVSGGANDGIQINDSAGNVIVGSYVGMTADGLGRLPNEDSGIQITGASTDNRVGGTTDAERNVVSGNNGIGVQMLGQVRSDGSCAAPERNVVSGNYLGVNAAGEKPGEYGNTGEGAQISTCARNNTIGGTSAGARNIISGNRADGIEIDASGGPGGTLGVCGNLVQGNYIGSDPSGMLPIPNVDDGIGIDNAACDTLIGGDVAGAGNLIGGNYNDGIDVARPGSDGTIIRGNTIGLAADGSTVLRNTQNGVHIRAKAQRTIIDNNTISANVESGILIANDLTFSTEIRNNRIGTTIAGTTTRANKKHGIWLYDGPRYTVIESNLIQGNDLDGVAVERVASTTLGNTIRSNRIRLNGGLGIDLLPVDGPNTNDGSSSDTSIGNGGMDHPVITQATSASVSGTAIPGASVELFIAEAGSGETHGEGASPLGSIAADENGAWCIGGLSISGAVTATATDAGGNTSEFAANVTVAGSDVLCDAPPEPEPGLLFADDFTAPDGSAPTNWEIKRSASGTGAGAEIRSNRLYEDVILDASQDGTWQYVQARATPVQPAWDAERATVRWEMPTDQSSGQTANMVLLPQAASGNALSAPDLLRVRATAGTVSLQRRIAGSFSTLWSGAITVSADMRGFAIEIDATTVTLFEGPPGSLVARTGAIEHGLTWTSGHLYLHASTNSTSAYHAPFDTVRILGGESSSQDPEPQAPTASFTSSCTDLTCTFTDGSSDADGTIVTWAWDFGDGTTSSERSPSHTYAAAGTYTVTLTVTDDDGLTDQASASVSVAEPEPQAPTASFTSSCTDLTCTFTDGSSDADGTIVTWAWDFGDGTTSSERSPSHTYAAAGTYTVTLTVTDDDGLTDQATASVSVAEPPPISLIAQGSKVKGVKHVDLSWSGATSTLIDVYRDGVLLTTTANDGSYTDATGERGGGTYTYQVCEAGTTDVCSAVVSVTF